LGFRVQGSGFGVWGSGFGVQGLGFRVWGSGFGVQGLGSRVWGSEFGVHGLGFRVWGGRTTRTFSFARSSLASASRAFSPVHCLLDSSSAVMACEGFVGSGVRSRGLRGQCFRFKV